MTPTRQERRSERISRWTIAWGLFDSRLLTGVAAAVLRVVRAAAGDRCARGLLDRFGARVVWSGWPYTAGYIHLHASRFYWRVRCRVWTGPYVSPRPIEHGRRLRVGIFANLHLTLGTQKPLFDGVPLDEVELHAFDLLSGGPGATYVRPLVSGYHPIEANLPDRVADVINAAHLDVLVNVVSKSMAYDVLDRLDTPCVVHACTGSDLIHHPKVSFHLYTQPECGYDARDGRVFCAFNDAPFSEQRVYESGLVCDARDLQAAGATPWRVREPLIVWHGSLYKLRSGLFLEGIFRLLNADRELRFEFFGRDVAGACAAIERASTQAGVARQVTYKGVAGFGRDQDGRVITDGFAPLASALGRARLWPDSFPVGGGSARFEAYAAGVPSIHMAARTPRMEDGPGAEGSLLELPWLRAPMSVAASCEDYLDRARRCLYEEGFATELVAEQHAVVNRVSDARGWWQHVLACYRDWESHRD